MNLMKQGRIRRPGRRRFPLSIAIGMLFLMACGPAASPSSTPSVSATKTGPKVVVIANATEWPYAVQYGHVPTSSDGKERYYTVHNNFTTFDDDGNPVPQIARKIPTIQDGDWTLKPDGSMEVTWQIRPNVKWHDGSPLTADDYVFGFEVVMDPRLFVEGGVANVRNVSAVRATDPQTLVVSWAVPWIFANANNYDGVPALKRDQIEPLYRTLDPVAFEASQVWRSEFVGLGPFRISDWALGSSITTEAFDGFYLGRPKVDRIEFRWLESQEQVAQMLAGSIDVIPVAAHAKVTQLTEIRQVLGANWGTAFSDRSTVRHLRLNFREDGPWAKDLRFRQAMAYSINRPLLAEALGGQWVELTDYVAGVADPVKKLADQRGVAKYPYDPARAAKLFAEAGWTKGTDTLLRNGAGETVDFPCCRYPDAGIENLRESLIWANELKSAGLDAHHPIPALPSGLSALDKRRVGTLGWAGSITHIYLHISFSYSTLKSDQIASAATRWTGANTGAYTHTTYDRLADERLGTIPLGERQEKELQLVRIIAEDLPIIVAYYNPSAIMAREGVTGVRRGSTLDGNFMVNVYEWDKN